MVVMHAVQFSRIETPADAAVRSESDFHLRGPRTSGGSQRGRIARLLRGRLHWMKVEEVESQSVPFSMLVGPLPPQRSREYSPPERRVKDGGAGNRRPCADRGQAGGRRRAKRRFPALRTRPASSPASRSSAVTGSPSRLTPPPVIRRRASLREAIPRPSTSRAGRAPGRASRRARPGRGRPG